MYNRAPADGSELATVQNGLPFEKLFQTLSPDGRNALFDATKFGWIGSITQTVFVTVTWHSAPVKTLQDATARQAILGASATSSDSYVLAMLTNRLLDTKFKVVHGYPGRRRGRSRGGERRSRGRGWEGLDHADLDAAAMDQGQEDQHPGPVGNDAARRSQGRADGDRARQDRGGPQRHGGGLCQVRHVAAVLCTAGRATGPAWRVCAARSMRPCATRRFLADAKQLGMEINPVRGEDVEALVTRIMATPAALAQRARDALKPQ